MPRSRSTRSRPSLLPPWLPTLLIVEDREYGLAERLNLAAAGKKFVCSFIEPGLVDYRDSGGGVELIKKEVIERALGTFVGNPLTIGHHPRQKLNDIGIPQGRITSARWNGDTGWFDCEGTVDTDEARKRIKNNERPSCGYTVLKYGPGGVYHNIPYDAEILEIRFHHLAIVDNPRYESADIRLNSKRTPAMFKLIRKLFTAAAKEGEQPTVTEQVSNLTAETEIEIDGKPVKLNALAAALKAKDKADADAAAKLEAEKANKISDDDEVEVDGKRVKVNALVSCYRQYGQKENEKGENKETSEEGKEERQRANAAPAFTAEQANAQAEADKKAKADADAQAAATERENAAKKEKENGAAAYRLLEAARTLPPVQTTERANSSNSVQEGLERGRSRYGSAHGKN